MPEHRKPAPEEAGAERPAEAQLAEVILQLRDEVARAKIQTFLHFATDHAKISVHVEPSREHGMRLILAYPFARS
jgi:hypothetical protein